MLRQRLLNQVATQLGSRAGISSTAVTKSGAFMHGDSYWAYDRINGREVVGFGANQGLPQYVDRYDYPYPAIRYRKDDETIRAIREKEKGDWKKLTIEEKKLLYRYSFEKTFAEYGAPNGHWKLAAAGTFVSLGVALLITAWMNRYLYKPLPKTWSKEWKEAELQRKIDIYYDPIEGIAAQYDYENDRWKDGFSTFPF